MKPCGAGSLLASGFLDSGRRESQHDRLHPYGFLPAILTLEKPQAGSPGQRARRISTQISSLISGCPPILVAKQVGIDILRWQANPVAS